MTTLYLVLGGALFVYFYWFFPAPWRKNLLLFGNVLFLSLLGERFFLWHFGTSFFNFAAALLVERHKKRSLVIASTVLICNAFFILFYRYNSKAVGPEMICFGISYFSLMNLGYFFQVYRGQISALRNFKDFYLFAGFFSSILLGPIEQLKNLLPQLKSPKDFQVKFLSEGVFLISLGFFKKFVIADRLHNFVRRDLGFVDNYSGLGLWLFFLIALIQIYCDFSAYIDMSRGFAKLLGINLSLNFDRPYLAKSVPEVWQRWNITLVNWLRAYLFVPLILKTKNFYVATFVVMLVMALWHEISFSLFLWACYWTFLYSAHYLLRIKGHRGLIKNVFVSRVLMIVFMSFGSIFFVSRDLIHLGDLSTRLISFDSFEWLKMPGLSWAELLTVFVGFIIVMFAEWIEVRYRESTQVLNEVLMSVSLLFLVMIFGVSNSQAFIYMRF